MEKALLQGKHIHIVEKEELAKIIDKMISLCSRKNQELPDKKWLQNF